MADPARRFDTLDDSRVEPRRGPADGTPTWVKVFGIFFALLVLLFLIGLVTGGHGPGRHMRAHGSGGQAPHSSATPDRATPEGGQR